MAEERGSDPLSPEHLRGLLHRHSLVNRRFREVIARTNDIPESEMSALAQLSLGRALTPGELGEALALTSGGTTELIHRLARRGYITRTPHRDDKRSSLLSPTPRAVTAIGRLYAPLAAALDHLAGALSENERGVVATYLEAASTLTREAIEAVQREHDKRHRDHVVPPAPELWA